MSFTEFMSYITQTFNFISIQFLNTINSLSEIYFVRLIIYFALFFFIIDMIFIFLGGGFDDKINNKSDKKDT